MMKRMTAFNLAIQSLKEKQQRYYTFDYHIHEEFLKAGYINQPTSNAHKNYIRIDEAIEMLETERDHKQLDLLETAEVAHEPYADAG